MKIYRPGLKPIYVDEAEAAPEPVKQEAPLLSIEAAMAAAKARDPAAQQTELIAAPAPLPLVNAEPPVEALSPAEVARVGAALQIGAEQEAAKATEPLTA